MRTIIKNARIFDGTGRKPFPGSVAVEGNRITDVSESDITAASGDRIINADGRVLMPGLVEAHAHLTWPTSVEKFVPGMYLPPEELALPAFCWITVLPVPIPLERSARSSKLA